MAIEHGLQAAYHSALARSSEREAFFHKKLTEASRCLRLPTRTSHRLETLLFSRTVPSNLLLANHHVRHASRHAFLETIVSHCQREGVGPSYFITFGGTGGVTWLSQPCFDMVAFQRRVDATLRRLGLSGIFSFEFDFVLGSSRRADHTVLFHCHGVVQPLNPDCFDLAGTRKSLAASKAFPSWNGAPGINVKRIGATASDVCDVAVYLADPFHQLKRRQPNRRDPSRSILRSTQDKLTAGLVLRAAEIQSHLPLRDTVFAVGSIGTRLRTAWLTAMRTFLPDEAQHGSIMTDREVWNLWNRIRDQDGLANRYRQPIIQTRSTLLRKLKHQ